MRYRNVAGSRALQSPCPQPGRAVARQLRLALSVGSAGANAAPRPKLRGDAELAASDQHPCANRPRRRRLDPLLRLSGPCLPRNAGGRSHTARRRAAQPRRQPLGDRRPERRSRFRGFDHGVVRRIRLHRSAGGASSGNKRYAYVGLVTHEATQTGAPVAMQRGPRVKDGHEFAKSMLGCREGVRRRR